MIQWLRLRFPAQGTWVQFLDGELRPYMLSVVSENKYTDEKQKKKKKLPQSKTQKPKKIKAQTFL